MAGEKVLIVEDNALNMELALMLLEDAGYTPLSAVTAEEGLELARSEAPRLILMDVSLPGMDGLTAVTILKSDPATRDIPVVVMTAHAMRGDDTKALEAGCDSYLTKPINTRAFLQVVDGFITNQTVGTETETDAAAADGTAGNVLIVDDDEMDRQLLEDLLGALGYRTVVSADGAAALAALQNDDPQTSPDLVLLDIMMPGMNGFEVARAVRRDPATGDLPIVMVTALSDQTDRLKAIEAGANDFISKPIDKIELQVRVASLIKMKRAQDTIKRQRADLEALVAQRSSPL